MSITAITKKWNVGDLCNYSAAQWGELRTLIVDEQSLDSILPYLFIRK